jgi:hypothetical protein
MESSASPNPQTGHRRDHGLHDGRRAARRETQARAAVQIDDRTPKTVRPATPTARNLHKNES